MNNNNETRILKIGNRVYVIGKAEKNRDVVIDDAPPKREKKASQLKMEARRSVGPSREGVAPARDEFLTVAASKERERIPRVRGEQECMYNN